VTRAGELNHRIAFAKREQVNPDSPADLGNTEGVFVEQFQVFAEVRAKFGGEAVTAARLTGQQPVTITVRQNSKTARSPRNGARSMSTRHRIFHPLDRRSRRCWRLFRDPGADRGCGMKTVHEAQLRLPAAPRRHRRLRGRPALRARAGGSGAGHPARRRGRDREGAMTSPSHELQAMVVERLKAFAGLTSLVGDRVYDAVPTAAQFPYCPGARSRTSRTMPIASKATISRSRSMPGRERLAAAKSRRSPSRFALALHEYETELSCQRAGLAGAHVHAVLRDPDGLTSHAVIEFSAFIEQP
jgi:head-tail adaptor